MKVEKNKLALSLKGLFFFLVISNLWINISFANGVIIPMPMPTVIEKIPLLKMKNHFVQVEINNQIAKTKIEEVFVNDFHRDIEGIYIFPLPEDSSISNILMFIDGKKVKGEILEKDKALKIYEDIVRKMRDPALLEYAGRNLYRLKIYPIPAKGEKKIEINYTQLLKRDAGIINYTYPLNVARFISTPVENLSLSVKIKSNEPIQSIYSPTYKIEIMRKNDKNAIIGFEEKNILPDKDFILYFTVSKKDFSLNLLTNKSEGEDGYFILFVSPSYDEEEKNIIPKKVIFIFDKSGSMAGKKIEQAKNALKFCINRLRGGDKFNIITFSSDVDLFNGEILDASEENISKGLRFIEKIEAEGGTNIAEALEKGLELLKKSSSHKESMKEQNMLIFITDGLPTVGETNTDSILKNTLAINNIGIRIFTFGVGYDVNFHFLDRLSNENKGVSDYVSENEDIELKISNFYAKVSEALFADTKIKIDGINVLDIYPKLANLPDIFKGSQLNILGRYKNGGEADIELSGRVGEKNKKYQFKSYFPEINEKNEFLPHLWATRKIGYLLDEIRLKGEDKEIINEIIKLSKKFGIVTPYTSSLVLEDKSHYTQMPAEETVNALRVATKGLKETKSGEVAFSGARMLKTLTGSDSVSVIEADKKIKIIGKRTFIFRDNKWIDTEYKNEKVIKIKYLSEQYFNLINKNPSEAKFLSLGSRLITNIGNRWYEVE